MRRIECVNCGKSKEINFVVTGDIRKNGFDFVWDTSKGLGTVILCDECSTEVKEYIKALEGILKMSIRFIDFSSINMDVE